MSATTRYAPVGARVRCAYWREEYTVLEHVTRPDWRGASVVVRWETGPNAGRVIEHSTALDKRDRIIGADTGLVHGPERPAVIAERYWCPSCDAPAGEPCRLGSAFQGAIHETRHRVAQRAMWRALMDEMPISFGTLST